jgi:hypothetical protein
MTKTLTWTVIVVIAGSLTAWYFSAWDQTQDHPSIVAIPEKAPETPEPQASFPVEDIQIVPEPVPVPPIPLPSLEESDEELVEVLAAFVGPELLGKHFLLEQVISRIVTTVDSLDARQLAPLVMPVKSPQGKFLVAEGLQIEIDPANSARYSPYMNILSLLDTSMVLDVYVKYYPLFQQAYAELGHGDVYFNDRLVEVVNHLLATPELTEEPELAKSEAVYVFVDEDLEALSAGQKIILRAGASNSAILMDKLRELRNALTHQEI